MPTIDDWVLNDPTDPHAEPGPVWWEVVHGTRRAITLRHPGYPLEAAWDPHDGDALLAIASRYLEKVRSAFDLPPLFAAPGVFAADVPMAWLPLDTDEPASPRASFWVRRASDPASGSVRDTRITLLAVEAWEPNHPTDLLASRLGIRITAHVAPGDGRNLRITGSACSEELAAHLRSVRKGANSSVFQAFLGQVFHDPVFRMTLKGEFKAGTGLGADTRVWLDGVRLRQTPEGKAFSEQYATASRPAADPLGEAYALTARFGLPKQDAAAVEKLPLVAHATPVRFRLFPRDPASMAGLGRLVGARPSRSPDRLDAYRFRRRLPGIHLDPGDRVTLRDQGHVARVMQSELVHPPGKPDSTEEVTLSSVIHARVDPYAALGGYQGLRTRIDGWHPRPLVETLHAYGLPLAGYFRLARLPVRIRYRAPISPGPGKDGKTVNAQVDYDPLDLDLAVGSAGSAGATGSLQVRFGLADLKRSVSRREPLGLATDPRWSWHEYCHVLLAAATGRLELVFAHSAGDALAAVLHDPYSRLARAGADSWARGYTFPWVYLHRRHDRRVFDGWSWCGSHHRPRRFDPVNSNSRHKGYGSEQILSTSLFRLYRALGGDTVRADGLPARRARLLAADYTAYLVLLAIRLLPWIGMAQLETPDQLVSLLTDADVGTWPGVPGPIHDRVGGWAHKVVRWAFEAQGLYATTDPLEIADRPGTPPDVDVFIDDRRPDAEGGHPRGGYMPVSLHADERAGQPPDWHAGSQAIEVRNGRVRVRVRNRGALRATGVTVGLWWTPWPAGQPLPPWDATAWTALGAIGPQVVAAWPDPGVVFGPSAPLPAAPSGRRILVLAAATCRADPANNDASPATGTALPCSQVPTPLVDLVAGDNNLGLLVYRIP